MEALAYMRNANFLISFLAFFKFRNLDIFRYLDNSRYIYYRYTTRDI